MSNEIIPSEVAEKEGGNLSLTATLPGQMATCQEALIAWARKKTATLSADVDELQGALEHARLRKWKTSTIARHLAKTDARRLFYGKMIGALEAGYVIVPNFPVTLFAIRTDRGQPLRLMSTRWSDTHEQQSQPQLGEGEGEYKNPFPLLSSYNITAAMPVDPHTGRKPETHQYYAAAWDEFEFPITMAKPQIMEAATNAMALKIFDQFGILPTPYKKEDPVIVAQLVDPRSTKYNRRVVTFMIAWNLDTRTL